LPARGAERDETGVGVDSAWAIEQLGDRLQIDSAVRFEHRPIRDDHTSFVAAQPLRFERPPNQFAEVLGVDDRWRGEHGDVGGIHVVDGNQRGLRTSHQGVRRCRYGAPVRSDRQVIAFLAFIGILMAFGIDAALPAFDELRSDFDLDARNISPAITGTVYFAGMAIGQVVAGVVSDRFGRRPVLTVGLVLYGLAAIASALAPTFGLLLAARFVWGLGAAAPSVLRFAIARDLYAGDRMARVVATFTAVFLIGPIFVPFIGEAILIVGSWRTVFFVGVLLAAVAFIWTIRFGETMAPEHRRPMSIRPFVDALRSVARTAVTRWSIIGLTLFGASFFVWLGSAQPIIDEVYGRDSQFTIFFGLSGAGMGIALLVNNRLIDRFGARLMLRSAAGLHVGCSVVVSVLVLAAGGVPSVWLWFGWAIVANAMTMVIGSMGAALAMEPMADKAGIASAILGVSQLGIGAVMASVVDAQIGSTVTPMVVGAVVFGVPGLAALLLATRRRILSGGSADFVGHLGLATADEVE
jgi:DHA1 family bicyclomycin/chloramphenicol resistance-like MFS transporter